MTVYTDDMLTAVKRDAFLTTAQGNFTDASLLAIGQDHLNSIVQPLLMSEREGWFRKYTDIPFVANQAAYTLPTYAMYGKLESIQYLDSSSRILPYQFSRLEIENLGDVLPTLTTGTPRFFTVDSDSITVYPTPSVATDSIRVYYDRRPGTLVLKAAAAQVLSVVTATGVVTYTATPPSTFTASSNNDFYNGLSPYQLRYQTTATGASGSTQTFPLPSVANLVTGDWVCLKDQTVFLPIPEELMPFLKDLIIASLARTQQDKDLYQTQVSEIAKRIKTTLSATGNRLPGNPKKIRLSNQLVRNRSVPRYR